jgi:putative protease
MEILIGKVKHFFPKVSVAVVELNDDLKIGDEIVIKNKSGEEKVKQIVESMEIDHKKVRSGKSGEEIAILVNGKVKEGDLVYKVS